MTGAGPFDPPSSAVDPVAVQLARLDERTLALQTAVGELRNDVRELRGLMATKGELRAWAGVLVLLVGALLAVVLHAR